MKLRRRTTFVLNPAPIASEARQRFRFGLMMSRLPIRWNGRFAQDCSHSRRHANPLLQSKGEVSFGLVYPETQPWAHRITLDFSVYFRPLDGRARSNSLAPTSSASAIWPRAVTRAETSARSIAPM